MDIGEEVNMHKLILIEGIPGSRKTTISKKVYNHLKRYGFKGYTLQRR